MKLLDSLYTIIGISVNDAGFSATIKLHADHVIFSGHFPGHPVTPGVVQLQLVHELLEFQLKRRLKLSELFECKFLKILDPTENEEVEIRIEYKESDKGLTIKSMGIHGDFLFFKLRGLYTIG